MRRSRILAMLTVTGILFATCGGGGGGPASPPPTPPPPPPAAKMLLQWSPPGFFTDNTPLTPAQDLDHYEIHVTRNLPFGPDDSPAATAPPGNSSFDLETLSPPLSRGVTYHAAIRAIPVEGEKSDYSSTVSFSLP